MPLSRSLESVSREAAFPNPIHEEHIERLPPHIEIHSLFLSSLLQYDVLVFSQHLATNSPTVLSILSQIGRCGVFLLTEPIGPYFSP